MQWKYVKAVLSIPPSQYKTDNRISGNMLIIKGVIRKHAQL